MLSHSIINHWNCFICSPKLLTVSSAGYIYHVYHTYLAKLLHTYIVHTWLTYIGQLLANKSKDKFLVAPIECQFTTCQLYRTLTHKTSMLQSIDSQNFNSTEHWFKKCQFNKILTHQTRTLQNVYSQNIIYTKPWLTKYHFYKTLTHKTSLLQNIDSQNVRSKLTKCQSLRIMTQ